MFCKVKNSQMAAVFFTVFAIGLPLANGTFTNFKALEYYRSVLESARKTGMAL